MAFTALKEVAIYLYAYTVSSDIIVVDPPRKGL